MNNVLYYPGFEPKDEIWLKFALLYFDTLHPIIPGYIQSSSSILSKSFQRIREETDLLRPYSPENLEGMYASTLACEKFDDYLRKPQIYGPFFGTPHSSGYIDNWRNPACQNYVLYNGKYSQGFQYYCIENGLATECAEGIRISESLAYIYMSLLADIISKKNEYEMITDTQHYSQFLINKDIAISKAKGITTTLMKNNFELAVPINLEDISLEQVIQLRNRRGFKEARQAYLREIESLVDQSEACRDYSYEDMKKHLSYRNDFIAMCGRLAILSAFVTVSVCNIFSLTQNDGFVRATAQAVVDYVAVKSEYSRKAEYIEEMKTKYLARKYVADLKQLKGSI